MVTLYPERNLNNKLVCEIGESCELVLLRICLKDCETLVHIPRTPGSEIEVIHNKIE